MAEYLIDNQLDAENIEVTVEFCRTLIPHIATKVPIWCRFPVGFFLINTYPAHKSLYNSIMHKIDSIKRENAKLAKKAEQDRIA